MRGIHRPVALPQATVAAEDRSGGREDRQVEIIQDMARCRLRTRGICVDHCYLQSVGVETTDVPDAHGILRVVVGSCKNVGLVDNQRKAAETPQYAQLTDARQASTLV